MYKEEVFWKKGREILFSWGWLFLFLFFSFFSYAHASKKKQENYRELSCRIKELTKMKEEALLRSYELKLEIQSQSDPKWIELSLMKGLGLVPKGKKKFLFQEGEG